MQVLQQAIEKVDRDLREATALSSSLTESLSAEGQAALTEQLHALQDLRAALERPTQDMLANREELQDASKNQKFLEQTSSLQGELQGLNAALEQELKAGEKHDGVSQLKKHWVNLKVFCSYSISRCM